MDILDIQFIILSSKCNYKVMVRFRNIALLVVFGIIACSKDYIEPDVSNVTIKLISPADNLNTSVLTHTFMWETFDDATTFNLQIISGTVTNSNYTVLDTNITTDSFTQTLALGNYYWKVKAYNSAYDGPYSTRNLVLANDNSSDISAQVIVLNAPTHNSYLNSLNVTFTWVDNPFVDDYRLEIYTPDLNGTIVGSPVTSSTNSQPYSFTSEGSYAWQVRGQNATSNTIYSNFSMQIDTTSPATPQLLLPLEATIITDSLVTLTWTYPVDLGTPITDSIYIYSDILLTNLYKSGASTSKQFTDTNSAGTFYWGIKSFDAAGNTSSYSSFNSFVK